MTLQQLFRRQDKNSSYKAVDETNTFLTEEEKVAALSAALQKKIGAINQSNYLKAVSATPVLIIPSFEELFDAVVLELKTAYGWSIDKFNLPVIKTLCYYFSKDKQFENVEYGYSLGKGLLITGSVGCGKTTLLKVLQHNNFNPYRLVSCRTVANEYVEFGQQAIKTYSAIPDAKVNAVGICFDDLGTESEKKNFGNQLNVMAEIVLNRYDNNEAKNKTHFTTNLQSEDILNYYGIRATSRMREMVNIIEVPFDAPDRRK